AADAHPQSRLPAFGIADDAHAPRQEIMATIYIETHGCQMNEADSQYIVRRATGAGYTLAERAEDASVLVLNTCTVRDDAEKRAYGRLHHWKAIKNADPAVRV